MVRKAKEEKAVDFDNLVLNLATKNGRAIVLELQKTEYEYTLEETSIYANKQTNKPVKEFSSYFDAITAMDKIFYAKTKNNIDTLLKTNKFIIKAGPYSLQGGYYVLANDDEDNTFDLDFDIINDSASKKTPTPSKKTPATSKKTPGKKKVQAEEIIEQSPEAITPPKKKAKKAAAPTSKKTPGKKKVQAEEIIEQSPEAATPPSAKKKKTVSGKKGKGQNTPGKKKNSEAPCAELCNMLLACAMSNPNYAGLKMPNKKNSKK